MGKSRITVYRTLYGCKLPGPTPYRPVHRPRLCPDMTICHQSLGLSVENRRPRPIVIEVLPVGTAALYCKSDGQQIYNTKFLPTLNIITFKLVKPPEAVTP